MSYDNQQLIVKSQVHITFTYMYVCMYPCKKVTNIPTVTGGGGPAIGNYHSQVFPIAIAYKTS